MTELEIASYLDRGLSGARRDQIEDHLVECAACRQSVSEAERLVQRVRRPRRVLLTTGLVAAAAAVFVILRPQPGSNAVTISREVSSESQALVAYGPSGETTLRAPKFVWGSDRDAVSYRMTLTRSDGSPVWTASGTDTTATLPDSVTLRTGERYIWAADAILSDGSIRSTGLKEFQTVR